MFAADGTGHVCYILSASPISDQSSVRVCVITDFFESIQVYLA